MEHPTNKNTFEILNLKKIKLSKLKLNLFSFEFIK